MNKVEAARERMLDAIRVCMNQGEALDYSDEEIERCMHNRCAEPTLIRYAKQFRDEGEQIK